MGSGWFFLKMYFTVIFVNWALLYETIANMGSISQQNAKQRKRKEGREKNAGMKRPKRWVKNSPLWQATPPKNTHC